jgi:hypothetical protein
MTQSIVTTVGQTVEILSVDGVVITDPVDDGTGTNTWVRSIRIFGEPGGVDSAPIIEVRIKSTTKANIQIVTPTLTF